jgi:hypothetical protein
MPRFDGSAFAGGGGLQVVKQFVQTGEPVRRQMQCFGCRVHIPPEKALARRPACVTF